MNCSPFSVVFLAGGVGKRMGSTIPKQFLLLNGKPLALYSFDIFVSLPEVQEIVVVCEVNYEYLFQNYADKNKFILKFARPGEQRQDSVFNGIQLLQGDPLVCIHDAARPLIMSEHVRKVVEVAGECNAAVLGVKARSTIKICNQEGIVLTTPNRKTLWEVQTPQVIRLNLLKDAFAHAKMHQINVTDDVALVELLNHPVKVVEGSYSNIKVTSPEDLLFAQQLIENHALL